MSINMNTFADKDEWLDNFRPSLKKQYEQLEIRSHSFLGESSLIEKSLGHLHYGLHKTNSGWIIREWAPNATTIYLLNQNNHWQAREDYQFQSSGSGEWELELTKDALRHGDHYKLLVEWPGGFGERIPSYAHYVIQDEKSKQFDAVVWSPDSSFQWKNEAPKKPAVPLIYEAHIGMSNEIPEVASYDHFRKYILSRIKQLGYNTIQLMAVQEHPYYGSFGYHVSSFFAASSRFGTPDQLKQLIDEAHGMGLRVIMDIVHSHAAKNELEGLSRFDGTLSQYFHEGERGSHPAWDSRTFDYDKHHVLHFLLSNLHFWLDEYRFDGFRFDGITSMIYHDHGLDKSFTSYDDYFSDNTDIAALSFLQLANQLIHDLRSDATTIAEDMSGFPGLAAPINENGIGFDYRLSMGVPDLWIKVLKEHSDENWPLGHLFHELTQHRPEERTISYAESHDQALVGDKTIIFRLADEAMYNHMQIDDKNLQIERAIALHKMIRLLTFSTNQGGYLNFMGNEFGHPEWIDFPREGNNWSYHYARRQWSLADNTKLKYHWLHSFDKSMLKLTSSLALHISHVQINESTRIISFVRGDLLFAFNFSPNQSRVDYSVVSPKVVHQIVLSSDDLRFGGQNRIDTSMEYPAASGELSLYLPARTALVLRSV